jgi:hypothetical protein
MSKGEVCGQRFANFETGESAIQTTDMPSMSRAFLAPKAFTTIPSSSLNSTNISAGVVSGIQRTPSATKVTTVPATSLEKPASATDGLVLPCSV